MTEDEGVWEARFASGPNGEEIDIEEETRLLVETVEAGMKEWPGRFEDPDEWTDPVPSRAQPPGPPRTERSNPFKRVDWPTFWATDHDTTQWAIEPIVPGGGRMTHVHAKRGQGKSELSLYLAYSASLGEPVLDQEAVPTIVGYIDWEMGEADLRDRLEAMGAGPETDLENFHYVLFPPRGLDKAETAHSLIEWLDEHEIELLFIDSITGSISGEENSNDAYQDLYDLIGTRLKERGISSVWLGNEGKSRDDSRGGSRKEDLFDTIWRLTRGDDDGVQLKLTKARQSWVGTEGDTRHLTRTGNPYVSYKTVPPSTDSWPLGTMDCAKDLDRLAVDVSAGRPIAVAALRADGCGRRNDIVSAAIKYRRRSASRSKSGPGF